MNHIISMIRIHWIHWFSLAASWDKLSMKLKRPCVLSEVGDKTPLRFGQKTPAQENGRRPVLFGHVLLDLARHRLRATPRHPSVPRARAGPGEDRRTVVLKWMKPWIDLFGRPGSKLYTSGLPVQLSTFTLILSYFIYVSVFFLKRV